MKPDLALQSCTASRTAGFLYLVSPAQAARCIGHGDAGAAHGTAFTFADGSVMFYTTGSASGEPEFWHVGGATLQGV